MRGCSDIFAVLPKNNSTTTNEASTGISILRRGENSKTYALHQIIFGYSARMFKPVRKYQYLRHHQVKMCRL